MQIQSLPNNNEAEQALIGSILIDEEMVIKIIDIVSSKDFFDPKLRLIFESIEKLYYSQQRIDLLTLISDLKKRKVLTNAGGEEHISSLIGAAPVSGHADEYANLVKEASTRRRLIKYSYEVSQNAFEEKGVLQEVLEGAEKGIFEISQRNIKNDFVHVSDLLEQAYEKAAELAQNSDLIRGIRSGFSSLDNILGGFQDSDLLILAARPSVGKSALILDFARYAAVDLHKSVGVFSLEMSNLQVMDRILAMQVGVGLWNLRMGKLDKGSFGKLGDAMGILSESNLYIDDTPGLHINEMMTKCRRLKIEKGLDIVIVDYLQLLTGNNRENRVQEVSEISRFLKILAKELSIPVIAAAQLSRAIEQRTDRKPQLSDLRESGSIEQDADIVMFLQREEIFNADTERKGIADLIISKHRNGPTGAVELFFVHDQARFRQLEKKYDI
jgi:replicative DNA helicase